jgi:hypothetical protein
VRLLSVFCHFFVCNEIIFIKYFKKLFFGITFAPSLEKKSRFVENVTFKNDVVLNVQ